MKQKDAVYSAFTTTNGDKKAMTELLVTQFNEGLVDLSSPQKDIKKYVIGLINNWMRKDTRLNGGIKYEIKNKGIRSGSSDPVVKNLKALLVQDGITDEQKIAIQSEIDKRIVASKVVKKPTVDMSVIPADIKAALGMTEDNTEE